MNPTVDPYFKNKNNWQDELGKLRAILLDCQLTEELKWNQPCYSLNKANVALIFNFKESCGISFFKGVLLGDPEKKLVAPGKNSRTVRMLKFSTLREIDEMEPLIKAYVFEAIEIQRAGLKVDLKEKEALVFTEELENEFVKKPSFKSAFMALTPGRQRGYNLFFSAPKQTKTRVSRIEKNVERILNGYGINDCTCGLTKRSPNCDGSHKQIGAKK